MPEATVVEWIRCKYVARVSELDERGRRRWAATEAASWGAVESRPLRKRRGSRIVPSVMGFGKSMRGGPLLRIASEHLVPVVGQEKRSSRSWLARWNVLLNL